MGDLVPGFLEKGAKGGVFFLYGEDLYRKVEAVNALVAEHVDPATRDFNYDLLRGSEVDVEALARVLATPPMMADKRVVVVREVEAFASSPRARQVLMDLAGNPPPDLLAILEATIPENSKAKLYKDLKRLAHSMEFRALSPEDVPGWLMDFAQERFEVSVEEDAARAIGAALGTDLGVLAKEIEKLTSLVGERAVITVKDVEAGGTSLHRFDRWQWMELVGQRRFSEARAQIPVLLDQGENGVGLVIGLATHLLRLGVALEQGPAALEAVLPPHQKWLAKRYRPEADGWTATELSDAILGLRRADRLLKASSLSERHHLEEWLMTRSLPAQARGTA